MSYFSWLRSRTSYRAPRNRVLQRPAAHRFRPRLEAPEDRTLPSTYFAATTPDLIADINAANKAGGRNTIYLTAAPTGSSYVLAAVDNTTNGANGLPVISKKDSLTIIGNEIIERSTAPGTPAFRLFDCAPGSVVSPLYRRPVLERRSIMWISSYLRNRNSKRVRRAPRRTEALRFRPGLEALEERTLLSSGLTLTNLVLVSGTTDPFANNTNDQPSTQRGALYPNSAVEPQVAVDPQNQNLAVAVWMEDRWSTGGARGLMASVTFDASDQNAILGGGKG